jgi:hypothetical protein
MRKYSHFIGLHYAGLVSQTDREMGVAVGVAKIKIAKIVKFDQIAKINGRENI